MFAQNTEIKVVAKLAETLDTPESILSTSEYITIISYAQPEEVVSGFLNYLNQQRSSKKNFIKVLKTSLTKNSHSLHTFVKHLERRLADIGSIIDATRNPSTINEWILFLTHFGKSGVFTPNTVETLKLHSTQLLKENNEEDLIIDDLSNEQFSHPMEMIMNFPLTSDAYFLLKTQTLIMRQFEKINIEILEAEKLIASDKTQGTLKLLKKKEEIDKLKSEMIAHIVNVYKMIERIATYEEQPTTNT